MTDEGAEAAAKIAELERALREQTMRAEALREEAVVADELTDSLIETREKLAVAEENLSKKSTELTEVKSMWKGASAREREAEDRLLAATEAAAETARSMKEGGGAGGGSVAADAAAEAEVLREQQEEIAALRDLLDMETAMRNELEERMDSMKPERADSAHNDEGGLGLSLADELAGLSGGGPPAAAAKTESNNVGRQQQQQQQQYETNSDDELPPGPSASVEELAAAESAAAVERKAKETAARQAAEWQEAAAQERKAREASEKAARDALAKIALMEEKMKADAKASNERAAQEAVASAARVAALMKEQEEKAARLAAAEASRQSSAAEAEALRVAQEAAAAAKAETERHAHEAEERAAAAQAEIDRIEAERAAQAERFEAERIRAIKRRQMLEKLQRMFPTLAYAVMESVLTMNEDAFDTTVEDLKVNQKAMDEELARQKRLEEDARMAATVNADQQSEQERAEAARLAEQRRVAAEDARLARSLLQDEQRRESLEMQNRSRQSVQDAAYAADMSDAVGVLSPNPVAVAARVAAASGEPAQISVEGMSLEQIAALVQSGALGGGSSGGGGGGGGPGARVGAAARPDSGDYGFAAAGFSPGGGAAAGPAEPEVLVYDASNPFAAQDDSNPFASSTHLPPANDAAGAAAPSNIWICTQCTLHNELSAKNCAVCDSRRPDGAAAAPAAPAATAAAASPAYQGGGGDTLTDSQVARLARDADAAAADEARRDRAAEMRRRAQSQSEAGPATAAALAAVAAAAEASPGRPPSSTRTATLPSPMPQVHNNPAWASPYPATSQEAADARAAAAASAIPTQEKVFPAEVYDAVTLQWLGRTNPRPGMPVQLKVSNLAINMMVESADGGSSGGVYQPFATGKGSKSKSKSTANYETIRACPIDRVLLVERTESMLNVTILNEHNLTTVLKFTQKTKKILKEMQKYTMQLVAASQKSPQPLAAAHGSPHRSSSYDRATGSSGAVRPLPDAPAPVGGRSQIPADSGMSTEALAALIQAGGLQAASLLGGAAAGPASVSAAPAHPQSQRTITITRIKGKGIGLQLRDEGVDGTVIAGLVPGSVAADAGAIPGDTIVALDGKSVVGMTHVKLVGILKKTGNSFTMTTDPPAFV